MSRPQEGCESCASLGWRFIKVRFKWKGDDGPTRVWHVCEDCVEAAKTNPSIEDFEVVKSKGMG